MLVEYLSIYVRILMTSMIYIRLENNAQVLDDHAPLKEKTLKDGHSPLQKEMYTRNRVTIIIKMTAIMIINVNTKTSNNNNVKTGNTCLLWSKCKPATNAKDKFDTIGPFLSKKTKVILCIRKMKMLWLMSKIYVESFVLFK